MNIVHLILAVSISVGSAPLMIALSCAYKHRRRGTSSVRSISMLFATSVTSLIILFAWPDFFAFKFFYILLLWGIFMNGGLSLAFLIHRFLAVPIVVLLVGIGVVEFAMWNAIDHRFRIVVQDQNGRPIDLEASEMALHFHPTAPYEKYYVREGQKLNEGEFHFGLLLWLHGKDHWHFSGEFHDIGGEILGDLEHKPAKFSEWPKHVIVN